MMNKNSDKQRENPYNISYENYLDTNACTECTGLMQNAAQNREEWEAYREIFDFSARPAESEKSRD